MRQVGLFFFLLSLGTANGAPVFAISDASAYIHADGGLLTTYNQSSPTFFSTLDADNLGTFGWTFNNTTGSTLTNFSLFGFLDADIDRDLNTFFNEYGLFVDLSLPSGAPGGAIGATSWQIDEPGFVFGTILNDLAAGSLQNANFVTSATPDDVSLALGFLIGNLAPGQTATLALSLSAASIGGLQQVDPDSDSSLHFNGYVTLSQIDEPSPSGVPEPSTFLLSAAGFGAILLLRKR